MDSLLTWLTSAIDSRKRIAKSNLSAPPMDLLNMMGSRAEDASKGLLGDAQATRSVMPQMQDAGYNALTQKAMDMGLLGIVKPDVAKGLTTKRNIPTDPLFSQAVGNTPNAQITPDGLLMSVQRNQLPEQGMAESVRGGVFYLPEGAAQAKHYSTGRNGYGGEERITGQTLIQNPLFAKGGTGGKAPESAFDALNGKGAYQTMRRDALHWGGGPKEIREEAVGKFLQQYAPEMEPLAGYILQNSTKGNQLAYALQEAAVASAVRRAGHDAVVGHSKGKSGPFISEIFDVRENRYPDKFGGYSVWDELRK
jgi:hypothetical protein